jgi:hypothetical protein
LTIQLDSSSLLNDYFLVSPYSTGEDNFLLAYNDRLHAFDFFSLNEGKVLKQTPLATDGPNEIPMYINGLYMHNQDSIFMFSSGNSILYLMDIDGKVFKKFNLANEIYFTDVYSGQIQVQMNFSIATIKLYYNPLKQAIYFIYKNNKNYKDFYLAEFFIHEDKMKLTKINFSQYYVDNKGEFGWMKLPNLIVFEDNVYYNFPIESNVYKYDLKNNTFKSAGGKSQYSKNLAEKYMLNTIEGLAVYKIENVHFHELLIDPYKNLIYRIHIKEIEYNNFDSESGRYHYEKKPMILTVFDMDFNILNEILLKDKTYSCYTSWFVNKEGLFLSVFNSYAEDIDFEKLIFHCYKFEKQ